jgi:hypothetical protein
MSPAMPELADNRGASPDLFCHPRGWLLAFFVVITLGEPYLCRQVFRW